MNVEEKTTGTLTSILSSAHPQQLAEFLEENRDSLISGARPFAAFMRERIREKGLKQQDVFLTADISEGYGYKLISEEKHTLQRDVILRLCLAAGFSYNETQKALKLYGMPPLYAKIPRDSVFIIAANNGLRDLSVVDEMLREHGFDPLYPCSSGE